MSDYTPRIHKMPTDFRHWPGVFSLTTSSPTASLGCAVGQFLIGATIDAQKVMDDAAANASFYVTEIRQGDALALKTNGYLSNAEITAGGNYLRAIPVKGIVFSALEDAVGGVISDANSGESHLAPTYADLIVANPGTAELAVANKVPYAHAGADVRIDSSTVNSSSSGLLIQLLGVDPSYKAASGAARRFLFKVIDAAAQFGQSDIS